MIAKLADAPYRGERTKSWLKIKSRPAPGIRHRRLASVRQEEDLRVAAAGHLGQRQADLSRPRRHRLERQGRRRNPEGARMPVPARPTRSQNAPARHRPPRQLGRRRNWSAKSSFTEFTPDAIVRHPSFLGLRRDKTASEVKLELPKDAPVAAKAAAKPKLKGKKAKAVKPLEFTNEMGIAVAERLGVKLTSPDKVVYRRGQDHQGACSSPTTTPCPSRRCATWPTGRCRCCAAPPAPASRSSRSTIPAASPTPSRR